MPTEKLISNADPTKFLDDVFQAIAYRSYAPGAPPASRAPNANATSSGTSALADESTKRKREDDDRDERMNEDRARMFHGNNNRPTKQPRRGGRPGAPRAYGPQGMPNFDPNNPIEALLQMQQAMAMQFPAMAEYMAQSQANPRQRRRGRCRDFDTKGYCSRGSTCMFDHGNDPAQLSYDEPAHDPQEQMMRMASMFNPAAMGFPVDNGRGRTKRGRGGRKGGSRAAFSADGPMQDQSKSTIVVENIPEEFFAEEEVRSFFTQFGPIESVEMRPYKHLAIVKFEKWGSANAAYNSPKVIFDNRFVKVFWYKGEGDKPVQRGVVDVGSADVEMGTEIDPEEFQRRQDEAQKAHVERESKRQEIELQRQDLEKQQQELLSKHREENEKLRAKLLAKNGAEATTGEGSETDALRAKLAELENEAKILGIDPEANDASTYGGSYRGGRGGRGRGRGRGRGSFRGTARHATYAQYTLDNRPKKISLTGVDFTAPEKDEALRHLLLNTGDYLSIEATADATTVAFADRKVAEKFYYTIQNSQLPGVDGKVELAWVSGPAAPVSAPATASYKTEHSVDIMDSNEDAGQGVDVEQHDEKHTRDEGRVVDMDYEMPEDEQQW